MRNKSKVKVGDLVSWPAADQRGQYRRASGFGLVTKIHKTAGSQFSPLIIIFIINDDGQEQTVRDYDLTVISRAEVK